MSNDVTPDSEMPPKTDDTKVPSKPDYWARALGIGALLITALTYGSSELRIREKESRDARVTRFTAFSLGGSNASLLRYQTSLTDEAYKESHVKFPENHPEQWKLLKENANGFCGYLNDLGFIEKPEYVVSRSVVPWSTDGCLELSSLIYIRKGGDVVNFYHVGYLLGAIAYYEHPHIYLFTKGNHEVCWKQATRRLSEYDLYDKYKDNLNGVLTAMGIKSRLTADLPRDVVYGHKARSEDPMSKQFDDQIASISIEVTKLCSIDSEGGSLSYVSGEDRLDDITHN